MIKRLEQVAALVVAAGLAIVSYWLFFSWAQGSGDGERRDRSRPEPRSQLEHQGLDRRSLTRQRLLAQPLAMTAIALERAPREAGARP